MHSEQLENGYGDPELYDFQKMQIENVNCEIYLDIS